jgi:hypothetical protein
MNQLTLIATGALFLLVGMALHVFSRLRMRPPRVVSRVAAHVVAAHPVPAGLERPMATLRVPNPSTCCELARGYAGKTFDAVTAPTLPIPGCRNPDCQCRYERAVNRRRGERRVYAERRESIRFEKDSDRRRNPDRRRANHAWE